MRNLLGGWQVSGATFFRTGTPFAVLRNNDIAGVGDGGFLQPVNLVGDVNAGANKQFSTAVGDGNFWFNPAAFAKPGGGHVRQRAAEPHLQPGRAAVGHRALQELQCWAARVVRSSARSSSTSRTTRTGPTSRRVRIQGQGWANPTSSPLRPRDAARRTASATAQLSLRFLF